jgi:hypothetical protein
METEESVDPEGDVVLLLQQQQPPPPPESDTSNKGLLPSPSSALQIKVSSRHLAFASPVFKVMFQGGFAESSVLKSSGSLIVALDEDNPAAILVLMHMVHGKFYHLPTNMSLQELKNIAVLVDKYDLHETVAPFTNGWAESAGLSKYIETEDLMSWVFICWVFGLGTKFQQLTQRWISDSSSNFVITPSLPIPGKIIGQSAPCSSFAATIRVTDYIYKQNSGTQSPSTRTNGPADG